MKLLSLFLAIQVSAIFLTENFHEISTASSISFFSLISFSVAFIQSVINYKN